jgi:hypothetical protein
LTRGRMLKPEKKWASFDYPSDQRSRLPPSGFLRKLRALYTKWLICHKAPSPGRWDGSKF